MGKVSTWKPCPRRSSPIWRNTDAAFSFIRSLMDSVEYRKTECGNVLEMRKKLA